ncbi:uncharacterized protein CCOS01_13842 [Colletotrichum costaricense]|uniref:Uncharacterized protein n=2 Tax=Colletotrichum acutatum species complex TaxID=2707335 RepID=A0AAJ0DV18_9PEZI|nr:uncharacterized protein CCOS01_13842 [Colletotrichum costaricense]XP_060389172.1 uncharacterized protein CTAM01_00495 [Colletotrichum tamarilloi]KAI3544093.1 hypothetical protein CSPX01_05848 [Colletotrichum filicis]KAK1513099.1 hypothetical protein CTAM01_00495 [Colletotrichum tamarilloi]KAK1514561.1 hypothetical protein CCOS01_13842 [Colletotrichum costaricense]
MPTYAATLPLDAVMVAAQSQKTVRAALTEPVLAPVEGKGCLYRALSCIAATSQAKLTERFATTSIPLGVHLDVVVVAGMRNLSNALLVLVLRRYAAEGVLREVVEDLMRSTTVETAERQRMRK